MSHDYPFRRLISSAAALILDSPAVVSPMMSAVDLPDSKADSNCLLELSDTWILITAADMQTMINSGADVNAKDNYDLTPLHWTAIWGNAEVIPVLVKARANVNATDESGETPLHSIAGKDLIPIKDDYEDWSSVRSTALLRKNEVISALLKAGADVNAKNNHGETPLDLAKEKKHWDAVKLLEKHGAK